MEQGKKPKPMTTTAQFPAGEKLYAGQAIYMVGHGGRVG